jgi:two-component system response regulator MtrA
MFKGTRPEDDQTSIVHTASPIDAQDIAPPTAKQSGEQKVLWRILVVEDDLSLANLEAGVLAAHGYAVTQVHNGEQALTALYQSTPDLVVLDFELSGDLTGLDVLQVLRLHASIPVLFTSSEETVLRKYMRASGETRSTLDHLCKPYSTQTLLLRVKRMLTIGPR